MSSPTMPTAAQAARLASTAEFVARFNSFEMPFCPLGMFQLHQLARNHPDIYDLAREQEFAHFDLPSFTTTALARHLANCESCNPSC